MLLFCLDALAACNYLPQSREMIIAALFKALNSTNNELQEAGEACMRKVSATSLIRFLLCPLLFEYFQIHLFALVVFYGLHLKPQSCKTIMNAAFQTKSTINL